MTELTLYLLRHGESVANAQRRYSARRTDPPLSALGEEQARRQGEALRVAQFTAILVSPLLRARQTAEIVSRGMGPRPVVCNALIEVDVGILDGENVDDPQGQRVYNEVITGWEQGQEDVGFPGGETLHDVRRRLERLLQVLAPRAEMSFWWAIPCSSPRCFGSTARIAGPASGKATWGAGAWPSSPGSMAASALIASTSPRGAVRRNPGPRTSSGGEGEFDT
jgi:hypothetical protein